MIGRKRRTVVDYGPDSCSFQRVLRPRVDCSFPSLSPSVFVTQIYQGRRYTFLPDKSFAQQLLYLRSGRGDNGCPFYPACIVLYFFPLLPAQTAAIEVMPVTTIVSL